VKNQTDRRRPTDLKTLRPRMPSAWAKRTDRDESSHRSVLNPLLMIILQNAAKVRSQLSTVNMFMKFIHVVQQQNLLRINM